MNENRTIRMICRVTPEEYDYIQQKMWCSGCKNMSVYLRKMAISGYVIRYDSQLLSDLKRSLCSIGNNVNQIAIRVNQNSTLYQDDMQELQEKVNDIWHTLKSIQSILLCQKQ